MYFLYATLLNNKPLLINFAITLACLFLILSVQYICKKIRPTSLTQTPDNRHNINDDTVYDESSAIKGILADITEIGLRYCEKYDYFYTSKDNAQKKFGKCELYDESAAPLGIILDIENIAFTYRHKHWLIQLQKGQYGLSVGCEVSLSATSKPPIQIDGYFNGYLYEAVDSNTCILISYVLFSNTTILLSRKGSDWCVNSFRLSKFNEPDELVMELRLTFPEKDMLNACYQSMINLGYHAEDLTVQGSTLFFQYDTPKSVQPLTRNILTSYVMQRNNHSIISAYNYLTQDYTDTLHKLLYVKHFFPEMYKELIKIGKPDEIFSDYITLLDQSK